MTFQNPLNHWRGGELKEPLLKNRALLARKVRGFLLAHPAGSTRDEITAALGDTGSSLQHLRKNRFARMSPSNAKANGTRGELWFASEPKPITP